MQNPTKISIHFHIISLNCRYIFSFSCLVGSIVSITVKTEVVCLNITISALFVIGIPLIIMKFPFQWFVMLIILVDKCVYHTIRHSCLLHVSIIVANLHPCVLIEQIASFKWYKILILLHRSFIVFAGWTFLYIWSKTKCIHGSEMQSKTRNVVYRF